MVDWFTAAVDGHAYMRLLGGQDFYHGFGYWVQGRTEFRPREKVHINIRSIFYSGSISGGYTEPTGQYHLFGFYVLWTDLIAGGTLEGRVIDIERQTVMREIWLGYLMKLILLALKPVFDFNFKVDTVCSAADFSWVSITGIKILSFRERGALV